MTNAIPHSLPRKHDIYMVSVLVLLMLGLVAWAAWAPIDKIVRAQGRIITASKSQVVQHLEGGIVSEILVHEGQKVQAGQTMMRLSDINANSNLSQGRSRLQSLKATQARLRAEAQGGTSLVFDDDIPISMQMLEKNAFDERQSRIRSEQAALQQQINQRQAELKEAQARSQSLSTELNIAKQQATMVDSLLKKGAASQMELLEAQSRTERLNTQFRDVVNTIPRLMSAQAESAARINESQSRFRAEARTEINQVTAEINRIVAGIRADSDRVSRTEVRAPSTGFVNRLMFNTIGGVVKPGEAVLEITPSEGPLAVEARVRPDDRASLRAGLTTRVMLGAYDYTVYGALQGEVVEVSSDTLPDENGQRYYRVVVETKPAQGPLAQEVILPGMTASADVIVGKRSVLSYLLSPLLRFSSRALREPH
ncbi:MAG: HlyD family type I secretion periplasmic adaptor subunit [Methylotenera sp.]|jgi:adhesin transport system membrane fusion protein|nr:HlyD family type I secretion periplasmic adaptor subunit [Methylotenera sp.]